MFHLLLSIRSWQFDLSRTLDIGNDSDSFPTARNLSTYQPPSNTLHIALFYTFFKPGPNHSLFPLGNFCSSPIITLRCPPLLDHLVPEGICGYGERAAFKFVFLRKATVPYLSAFLQQSPSSGSQWNRFHRNVAT